jgi:hypothetical protein
MTADFATAAFFLICGFIGVAGCFIAWSNE